MWIVRDVVTVSPLPVTGNTPVRMGKAPNQLPSAAAPGQFRMALARLPAALILPPEQKGDRKPEHRNKDTEDRQSRHAKRQNRSA
jgi:hypothetical protein